MCKMSLARRQYVLIVTVVEKPGTSCHQWEFFKNETKRYFATGFPITSLVTSKYRMLFSQVVLVP